MLIQDIQAFPIRIPSSNDPSVQAGVDDPDLSIPEDARHSVYSRFHETCVIRIESDEGLVGWGEGQSPVGARAIQAIIQDICGPLLKGTSPFSWEAVRYRLYNAMRERGHEAGFYPDALAGIDIAVFDLLGKATQLPVWKLLQGGFTCPIPLYVGISGQNVTTVQEQIRFLRHEEGYAAFKIHATQTDDDIVSVMIAAREEAGTSARIMLDLHGTRDVQGAIDLGEKLRDVNLYWLEAPCSAEDSLGHAEIREQIPTRLATGEWLRTVWTWKPLLDQRGCDVAMPDIARTGFVEGRRIATLCDAENLEVSPHVGGGGILATAASIHFSATLPRFTMMEHSHSGFQAKGLIASSYPEPKNGVFELPNEPGLGVTIDEDRLGLYNWTAC